MPKKVKQEDFSFRPFMDLRKVIDTEAATGTSPESKPPRPSCLDDEELFLLEMRGVREIKEFRQIHVPVKGVAMAIKKRPDADTQVLKTLRDISGGRHTIALEDTDEYIAWTNSTCGCTEAVAKKLHEGRFSVQDFLDLHGFTVEEAEVQVDEMLRGALTRGLRCIKIIHGRGLKSPQGPVLKEALVKWLAGRYRKNIIAFCTARQCDGGLGALYILLKRNRG